MWRREECLIKKAFKLEAPAQQKITAEGKATSSFHLCIIPNTQTLIQTQALLSSIVHLSLLQSSRYSLTIIIIIIISLSYPFCKRPVLFFFGSPRGQNTKPLCSAKSPNVFWLLSTSTQRCHGDILSTLPVKPTLTAATKPSVLLVHVPK